MIKKTIQALTLASLLSCSALLQAKPQQNYSLLPLPKTEYSQIHFNLPSFQISLKDEDSLEEKCKRGEAPSYLCPDTYVAPKQETAPEEKRQEYLTSEEKTGEKNTTASSSKSAGDYIWGGLGTAAGLGLILFGLTPMTACAGYSGEMSCEKGIPTIGVLSIGAGALLLASSVYLMVK